MEELKKIIIMHTVNKINKIIFYFYIRINKIVICFKILSQSKYFLKYVNTYFT